MKKFLLIITPFFGIVWILGIFLYLSIDLQLLEPKEHENLKEGKFFCQWNSPYGPLNTHYIEKGEGDHHVLLIHGFRSHSYTWKNLIDPIAEAGYHVWAIDLMGFGLSDKPEQACYHTDFFIGQIEAFMEEKKIQRAHVVGNSMGGGMALILAMNHPEKVQSLMLLSALGYPLDMPLYLSFAAHFNQIWVPFLGPKMVKYCLENIVANKQVITKEQVEAYSLPYRLPGGITASLKTLQKFDNQLLIELGKHYSSFSFPILIIWGEEDTLIPTAHYRKFLKDFPHADHLLIPHCGHIPQEENPQEVLSAALKFLKKINPAL